jgi:uncharacterized lipoprotein
MRNSIRYIGLAIGVFFLTCLMLTAGCSHDSETQADKEAAKNAAKAPTTTAAPAGASKSQVQPPPP